MKNLLLFSLTIVLFSCSKKQDNFSKYEWIQHYTKYNFDDGSFTLHQRVAFKNDSAVSISELTGETARFPLIKKDSLILFKRLLTVSKSFGVNKKDTIMTDTLLYDFKNIFNNNLLILKNIKSDYHDVLTTSKNNEKIEETNNFLSIINFKIGGFQIGDSISISNFENIEDYKTYDDTSLISASPKGNENIEVHIIDKKYIFRVFQKKIERNDIENIIKVINKKIKIVPDTIKRAKPFYNEGFRWQSNGIDISLQNRDLYQYYKDKSKDKKVKWYMRDAAERLMIKELGNAKYYKLEYDNKLLQSILQNIGDKTIQSSIIE